MPTPRQRYARRLNGVSAEYGSLEDSIARRNLEFVRTLRVQLADEMSNVESLDGVSLNRLQRRLDTLVEDYEAKITNEVNDALLGANRLGGLSVTEPLQIIEVGVFHQPSQAQINALSSFSAELIQNITTELRETIDQQLRLATIGGSTPFQTMQAITTSLGTQAQSGKWSGQERIVNGVAPRAEAILRTEMQRVFNIATDSQQRVIAERVPGLLKTWTATADRRTRQTHLQAHVRYHRKPIPIADFFEVGTAKLLFPADPGGEPEEVIGCRCISQTVHPTLGVIGTNLDGRISSEAKKRAK